MKIGTFCYDTSRGLGHLARSFVQHGVVTDVLVIVHPSIPSNRDWYPEATRVDARAVNAHRDVLQDFVRGMDIMLFFETPFDWSIIGYCREHKIKTVLMTMYECTPKHRPHEPDLFLCPSVLDMEYFPNRSVFLPIPVEMPWKQRTVARNFIHNGGYLGLRGREGTENLIDAMAFVESEATITIRCQENVSPPYIKKARENPKISYCPQNISFSELFETGDVFVAPQKFNGCSLPLQEAYASGMAVMSTNRYPMNTWLDNRILIPVQSYRRAQVGASYLEFEEAVVDPRAIARMIDYWYGKDISELSLLGKKWAEETSWEVLKSRYMEELLK